MTDQEKPTCKVIRAGNNHKYIGKQSLTYFEGISSKNTGAKGICMHLLKIQPGGKSNAHLHEDHETVLYILSGAAGMWYGEKLDHHLECKAMDYLYIPPGVPHLPYNLSDTEPCIAVVARTDPDEQESVVLLPELDKLH